MKSNNCIMMERIKESVLTQNGCTVAYLKSVKSDLAKLFKQYLALKELEIVVLKCADGYKMDISVFVKEFYDIGKGE